MKLTARIAWQVRANPEQYAETGLGVYLQTELSKMLTDDEIKLDMVQILVVGTYGLATQVLPSLKMMSGHDCGAEVECSLDG